MLGPARRQIPSLGRRLASLVALWCFCTSAVQAAPGTVYLVLGSDTAIWNSADQTTVAVTPFSEYFPPDLYTNRSRNAYTVFSAAFRNQFVDSYGTPVKLTWWAMGGNMFRYAANTDAGPCNNSMILYLLKTHHGDGLRQFGDQLSYHWHNFYWTGSQWAKSATFEQCQDDFDFTIAQYLLEEGIYPMSFRTGWEWNSNPYQNHINLFMPFTLSAYWLATCVPYHPSPTNYRVAGTLTGWEVWDAHMKNVTQTKMNSIFAAAAGGQDQVACLWGHLPEPDFTSSIAGVDAKARAAAAAYPTAKFRYCTATEAMQHWLGTTGQSAPQLELTESLQGDTLTLTLQSDKAIFQAQPFVACKDKDNQTTIVSCTPAGANTWTVTLPVGRSNLARVGMAVSDDTGHLATRIHDYATIAQGQSASFLLYAQGSASLAYQWQHNSSAVAGATSSVLSLPHAQVSDAGTYTVSVTNSSGDIYTEVAHLTVYSAAPLLTVQPQSQTVYEGAAATLSADALGNLPLGFQWQFNGADVPGATAKTYVMNPVRLSDAGTYSVVVTNSAGATNSLPASLTVLPAVPPAITSAPLSQSITQGWPLTLTVQASGSAPLSYQWRFNSAPVSGATTTALSIPSVQVSEAGSYDVVVTNWAGRATSAVAVLTVVVPPPARFTAATLDGSGRFRLAFEGLLGTSYLVEASTNFLNWLPLTTTCFGSNALGFTDPATVSLPCRFYRARTMSTLMMADFEGYSPGTAVMYRTPSYSGSTSAYVDTSAACFAYVTDDFPAGHAGARVLQARWKFNPGSANWLRLTATGGAYVPNPAVNFGQGVQFDLYTDRALYVAIGLRETSTTAPLGGNGGSTGSIEFVGGVTDNTSTPVKGRLVPAEQWTTLRFFFPYEPIKAFASGNGNGVLDSTTGKGAFEHLTLVPVVSGPDTYNVYLDNFQIIFIRMP